MPRMLLLAALIAAVPALALAQPDKPVQTAAKPAAYARASKMTGVIAKKRKPKPDPVSDLPSGPKAMVGTWVIGKDGEGASACTIRLNAPGVIGGFQLVAPKSCKDVLERWDDLYAWYIATDGDLVMADGLRQPVLVFHKLNDDFGDWATEGDTWDRLLLARASSVGVSR